jgi:large subunit ribosomal protein L21
MKAVVKIGGKQFVVTEKETLLVDLLQEGTKELTLDALLVIDGDKTTVGTPTVSGVIVTAKVVEELVKGASFAIKRKSAFTKRMVIAKNILGLKSLQSSKSM